MLKRIRVTGLAGAALLALTGGPATAADPFPLPQGCHGFLTVQMRGCEVALLYRCDLAPPGDTFSANFDGQGLMSVNNYDRDYVWVSTEFANGTHEETLPGAARPLSLDELLATGLNAYDFDLLVRESRGEYVLHVQGEDRLRGESATVDGVALDVVDTRITMTNEAGETVYDSRGYQYLSREMRQFFLGEDETIDGGTMTPFDSRPVDFIFPGEPGFGVAEPQYDCDAKLSALPLLTPDRG